MIEMADQQQPEQQQQKRHYRSQAVPVPYLVEWRARRLMNQAELAAAAGVARSTIASAERGAAISFTTLRKLAAALGVTVQQLREEEKGPAQ